MIYFGHNASLNNLDGNRVFDPNPSSWGPLIPKAEYLAQYGKVKAWEIYILPFQLRPQALEQLAQAMPLLAKHPLFDNLEWLSFHFPTTAQPHSRDNEISQEDWRPFYQLLQVLDRFPSAKQKNLNLHILAEATLADVWHLNKQEKLVKALDDRQATAATWVKHAVTLKDHVNSKLTITIENNPPYHNKAHAFHLAGLFPQELKQWQSQGANFCLDIQHATLVHWYRERYGYDGPIPPLNELHHRSMLSHYVDLAPLYVHAAGAPDTPESLHQGSTIGQTGDDIDWRAWMDDLRILGEKQDLPIIIELEEGHLSQNWPSCQTSLDYLKKLTK